MAHVSICEYVSWRMSFSVSIGKCCPITAFVMRPLLGSSERKPQSYASGQSELLSYENMVHTRGAPAVTVLGTGDNTNQGN